MSLGEIARIAGERIEARKREEAAHPEVLDKWKKVTPQIAGTAAGVATGTIVGKVAGPTAGHAAGQVASAYVRQAVEKNGVSTETAHHVRDTANGLDDLATILAAPIYLPAKWLVCKIFDLEF